MADLHEHVLQTYQRAGLENVVLQALEGEFGDLSNVEPDHLAPIDGFHIRGRSSTVELAQLVDGLTGQRVLDVGCGLGGTARHLASNFDAHVIGIDLNPEYVSLAENLSDLVGLGQRTSFRQATAPDLPFHEADFDVVWMEHVQMNIPSSDGLTHEVARVLRGGGRFAFHEIFSANGVEPYVPVPWADDSSSSALVPPEDFRESLERAGLETVHWLDVTEPALQWATGLGQRIKESGPPPLGLHLLMGDSAQTKLANVRRNLEENRICVVQAVLRKPA